MKKRLRAEAKRAVKIERAPFVNVHTIGQCITKISCREVKNVLKQLALSRSYLWVTFEQGVVPVSSPEAMKFRVDVRRGIVCLMGRGDS